MIQYILVMILMTAYSSEGIPLAPSAATNGSLANSLQTLANRCQNAVLVEIINKTINNCRVSPRPPYNELQLQCLIFYDINSQLCDAATPESAIHHNVTAAINQPLDVEELCKQPMGTQVVDLPEYPTFKPTIEKVFKNMILCARLCGVPEVASQDSNFFCKYFKWGIGVLNSLHKTSMPSADAPNQPIQETSLLNKASVPPKPVANNKDQMVPDIPVSASPAFDPHPPKNSNRLIVNYSKLEASKLAANEYPNNDIEVEKPIDANNDANASPVKNIATKPVDKNEGVGKTTSNNIVTGEDKNKPSPLDVIENPSNVGIDNVLPGDLPTPKPETKEKDTVAIQEVPLNGGADKTKPKKSGVQKQKPEVDTDLADDYQDSEDGRDVLPDMPLAGDNIEDPLLTDGDTKLEQNQPIALTSAHKNAPSSSYSGDRDTYATNYQDVFPDDDDHFFPLFLSGIVLVVLLYVLYHNKNKVTKVVLGLIVEGRQNGRRRGSRGHAYRRLDTLEQAMSAPSSAAPNKIIY